MTKTINFSNVAPRFLAFAGLTVVALIFAILPAITHAQTLGRQLEVGMSGSDVSALQTFLAKDATLYPQGLVTGYFGFLTKAAVSNFQSRNGIATVGRVGPITLAALNLQMAGGMTTSWDTVPTITNISVSRSSNNATVSWNTNEPAKGVVYYSTSPLTTYDNETSVSVSGATAMTDANFRNSQSVSLSGLQANTTYYYLIYATDQGGNVSVTWPTTFETTN